MILENKSKNIYKDKIVIMAKKQKDMGGVQKQIFGKAKVGVAKKSWNKHSPKPKAYRGQGR